MGFALINCGDEALSTPLEESRASRIDVFYQEVENVAWTAKIVGITLLASGVRLWVFQRYRKVEIVS
jgi:hypothetical protein